MENIAGMPVVVSEHVPKDECWLVSKGIRQTIHIHEGPQAGQDVEAWLKMPRIVRLINLGEDTHACIS